LQRYICFLHWTNVKPRFAAAGLRALMTARKTWAFPALIVNR
jgi:hypothetical protein